MRKYRANAASPTRVHYGIDLCEGLAFFEETAFLAPDFAAQNEELDRIHLDRLRLERALVPQRAKVRFGNYLWDVTVRSLSKSAEIADDGVRGSVHAAIFPNGLGPVVVPSGAGQVKPARDFVTALEASKAPGVETVRGEWLPKLKDALSKLESAVEGRKKAYVALEQARAAEEAAKDDHELSVVRIMGQIRAIFPKDKRKHDVIFPPTSRAARREEVEESDEDESVE